MGNTTAVHAESDAPSAQTTVLFTDIIGSTELASTLGDRAWRDLLDRHEELLREHVAEAGGRVVDMIGDGSLSLFDGPARAISCAHDFAEAAQRLDTGVRAGLQTSARSSTTTSLGSRSILERVSVLSPAVVRCSSHGPSQISSSAPVLFSSRGAHELKGVPGSWELFALASGQTPTVPVVPERPRMRPSDRAVLATARRAPALLRLAGRVVRS